MLRKLPGVVLKKSVKPAMYLGLIASLGWLALDVVDGAKARIHQRVDQVQDAVEPGAVEAYAKASQTVQALWDSIVANPGPSILAIAVFGLTVVYHRMKGKSVFAAAMAAARLPVEEKKDPVLDRLKADLLIKEALNQHELISKRLTEIPKELTETEWKAVDAEKEATCAERSASDKRKHADFLKTRCEQLRKEQETAKAELAVLADHLDKV